MYLFVYRRAIHLSRSVYFSISISVLLFLYLWIAFKSLVRRFLSEVEKERATDDGISRTKGTSLVKPQNHPQKSWIVLRSILHIVLLIMSWFTSAPNYIKLQAAAVAVAFAASIGNSVRFFVCLCVLSEAGIEGGGEEKIDINNGDGDIWCWVTKKKKNWRW